ASVGLGAPQTNILAVGAHPDDVELGCFGTLLEKKRSGHNVYAVALAPGAYGTLQWDEIEAVWSESRKALRAGGGKGEYFLGKFPRSEEHTSELQSLAYLVCR